MYTGVPVSDPNRATSALRLPGRWARDALASQRWPRHALRWAELLLKQNPLRRQLATWEELCGGCPDWAFIRYVLTHGLVVTHPDQRPRQFIMQNHASALTPFARPCVAAILAAECAAGFISTPPTWVAETQCKWVHALGAVPKGDDAVRIIHDFSAPSSDCLNSHIDYLRMSYDRVDAVFAVLRPRRWLAKIDISAFFRHIPLDPADWGLMAFSWDGKIFVDTRLNFGQRNAPEVAARFSDAVMWHVKRGVHALGVGCCDVFVVCDDWLVVADDESGCRKVWNMIIQALQGFGFTVNTLPHKCIPPCFVLIWLGLELDTVMMTVRLPAAKVAKALALVSSVAASKKVTRQGLDSLFGYLSFCCSVVYGGRAFLHGVRRLRFRPEGGVRAATHHVHVNQFLRDDMSWWQQSLELRNGDRRSPIVAMHEAARVEGIFIDARGGSGGVGMFVLGGFLGLTGSECNALYPSGGAIVSPGNWALPSTEANHWELFAFVVLLDVFPAVFEDTFVAVDSDSMTAIKCVRDLSAALDSPALAALTRTFLGQCVRLNTRVLPRHIAGEANVLADPLSRDMWAQFGTQASAWCGASGFGPSAFLLSLS